MPERHTAQPEPLPDAPVEPVQPPLTCSLQKPEQLTQALADCRPEMIYLPVEWLDTLDVTPYLDRTSFCAVLPAFSGRRTRRRCGRCWCGTGRYWPPWP